LRPVGGLTTASSSSAIAAAPSVSGPSEPTSRAEPRLLKTKRATLPPSAQLIRRKWRIRKPPHARGACFMEEAMNRKPRILIAMLMMAGALPFAGCQVKPQYGTEAELYLPVTKRQVWAVAPALNLSGQKEVDPLLQAD